MSQIFYGINNGDNSYNAAVGSSTTSKDVEIVVNTAANVPSREELLLAVEKLEDFITRQPYTPV